MSDLKPRPRPRHSWAWTRSVVGERVEITGVQRFNGRRGLVLRTVDVAAGGANARECLIVALDATSRAAAREVRVYPSSVTPLE